MAGDLSVRIAQIKRGGKYERENPLDVTMYKLASNLVKRTITDVDNSRNAYYKRNGIKCLIGNNTQGVLETLKTHYRDDVIRLLRKGEKPSVDRIDPKGHYELGNIQIVSFEENMRRSDKKAVSRAVTVTFPDNSKVTYESILRASKEIGCKRDTIYHGAKYPGTNKKGLEFEIREPYDPRNRYA